MDISSLLERAPQSPTSDNASSTSQGSQLGYSKRMESDQYSHTLPPMTSAVLQPPFAPQQPGYQPMLSRFQQQQQQQQQHHQQQPPYHPQQYPPPSMSSYGSHQPSYSSLPPLSVQERRMSIPNLPMNMPPNMSTAGPTNKRLAPPVNHPSESPAKKKQSKWSGEEDAAIIELRGNGMKWEDISKHLPGRSAISCRLRFQNYLERRSEWDDEKKNKLARLYERFKKDMWEKIAKEMQLPWRAAEAMHWQIGEVEMASRANVPVFHLANPSSQTSSQPPPPPPVYAYSTPGSIGAAESGSNSTSPSVANGNYQGPASYPSTHNHTLPQMSQPVSPRQTTRRTSTSSIAGAEHRGRADSARETIMMSSHSNNLEPGRSLNGKRFLSPFTDRATAVESN